MKISVNPLFILYINAFPPTGAPLFQSVTDPSSQTVLPYKAETLQNLLAITNKISTESYLYPLYSRPPTLSHSFSPFSKPYKQN